MTDKLKEMFFNKKQTSKDLYISAKNSSCSLQGKIDNDY